LDVVVWVMLSLLTQVTVVPVATVRGLMPNAFVVNVDTPLFKDIVEPEFVVGVGVGVDDDEELLLPHADVRAATAMTARQRLKRRRLSMKASRNNPARATTRRTRRLR
jgi:hypothetical protein